MKGKSRDKSKKTRMNKGKSLFSLWNYLIFFALTSFLVTCSFYLFLHTLDIEIGMEIQKSAALTFGNVMILSLLCTIIDALRRKYMVERPVKRILNATKRITKGDFSTRIEPFHNGDGGNEFDLIARNLNTMAEELGGIETLRTDFITNVSHELKTPLSVMQNYAALLQNPALPEDQRMEYAKTITEAVGRLSELMGNILKLNKLENQQIFPDVEVFNLREQLCECLLAFEDVWDKKGLDIQADMTDVRLEADAELLTLVWNNLFSNAVKFTETGGAIGVSLQSENGFAVVRITDTGCGMPPEVGRRIFEKFYQGDRSHATRGNGLGLALVKRVVDIVDGEISVESAVGQGSVFTVKLPMR